jgi:hypothetical protein
MAVVTQIQVRRGTASQWTSANPTLASGEWGFESDTNKTKIGDGSTAWNSLAYATGSVAVGNITGLGSGVATFLATPSSSNLASAVSDETGTGALVFGTSPTLATPTLTSPLINMGINAQTGTTYTPVLGDNGKLVTLNNASAITVSIPTNASVAYPTGAQISFAWITGAGQPTIQAATSGTTTILSTGGTTTAPKLRVANSTATCLKIATDTWIVMGDIS